MMAASKVGEAAEIWGRDEYQFDGQRHDEQVMLLRRQHPAVLARLAFGLALSVVIPYALIRALDGSALGWSLLAYALAVAYAVARRLYGYLGSVMVLTNQRLLDVSQSGFFVRTMNEAELNRIQDVSSQIKGVWQTAFRFGQVTIRTASKESALIIENIARPYEVQQAIVRALNDIKRG